VAACGKGAATCADAANGEGIRQAATELMEVVPDAIVSTTSTTTRALADATGKIPIVTAISGDLIALGFTKVSLAQAKI
jgi:ABC-type uncharacterized transport system substrate-binding protein